LDGVNGIEKLTGLFLGLTDQQLKSIEKGEEVSSEAGDKILAEGEHNTFYVVLEGKVDVILRDGTKEDVLSSFDSGDHFGFKLFLDGQIIHVPLML
jgi:CRP-like cAMP-binding protein